MMDEEGYELGVIEALVGTSQRVLKEHYVSGNRQRKKITRAIEERNQTQLFRTSLAN